VPGATLNFSPIDPIEALYRSAVPNGFVAVMERFTLPMRLRPMGRVATVAKGWSAVAG